MTSERKKIDGWLLTIGIAGTCLHLSFGDIIHNPFITLLSYVMIAGALGGMIALRLEK